MFKIFQSTTHYSNNSDVTTKVNETQNTPVIAPAKEIDREILSFGMTIALSAILYFFSTFSDIFHTLIGVFTLCLTNSHTMTILPKIWIDSMLKKPSPSPFVTSKEISSKFPKIHEKPK